MMLRDDNHVFQFPYLYDEGHLQIDLKRGLQPTEQVFSFFGDDGTVFHFDIPKMYRMIASKPLAFATQTFSIRQQDYEFLVSTKGVDKNHALSLSTSRLNEKGLVVRMPDATEMIVDGNHRFVGRYMRGTDHMDFYIFTYEQAKPALLDIPADFESFIMET